LIKNALEAMPDGGILTISSEISKGRVITRFVDTGQGIDDENFQRIFQPFFTTKGPQSSGLGLSSSYGLVKKHRGEIRVSGNPSDGTTFAVDLPLALSMNRPREHSPITEVIKSNHRIRFLMIDDEENILKMMMLWFEDSNVELQIAGSGEKALQAIRNGQFDIIMCDFGMEDMNGLAVGKAHLDFCRTAGKPKTPFLLLTGLDTKLDAETLQMAGVDRTVKKPVSTDELYRIIQETIAVSAIST
jgi:CheY-like chemotaxis protein